MPNKNKRSKYFKGSLVALVKKTLQARERAEREEDRKALKGSIAEQEKEILGFFAWLDKEGREGYQNPSYDPNRSGALALVDAIQDYRRYKKNEELYQKRKEAEKDKRVEKQEGGEAVADQMNDLMMMPQEEEEIVPETPMESDEEMEDNYIDFIVGESLTPEDEEYLLTALEQDDRLSMIFDQVVETASEFAGSGPVEGPGTGMSDSIPARLSDGEFVITSKATEEIGPDNLQSMMEQAEMDADARQMRQEGGYIQEEEEEDTSIQMASRPKQTGQALMPEQLQDRENKKNMMMLNPRNTLLAR